MTVQIVSTVIGSTYLRCDCDRTAIRKRTQSNGVQIYVLQCLECGRYIRAISKKSPEVMEMPNVMPFDEGLQEEWRQRQNEHNRREDEAFTDAHRRKETEWWKQYNTYLQTSAWRQKRQAVLTRANNLCEGCRQRQATHVHHLTYDHAFNEFLFELVAVCESCHHRIHPEMD